MRSVSAVAMQMLRCTLLVSLFAASAPAIADLKIKEESHRKNDSEIRLYGLNLPENTQNTKGPYMVLACRDSRFSFQLNWRERVGKFGEKRRHLFYHVDGDNHILLSVVNHSDDSTGYANQPDKAKSLVHEIFSTVSKDTIPIGVFPAGRDPATGSWIDAWFSTKEFKKSAVLVGRLCKFDPEKTRPNSHSKDKVLPGSIQ